MKKFIVLLKHSNSRSWFVANNEDPYGGDLGTAYFDTEEEAIAQAVEVIEFDEEANGKPDRGVNYEVVPVQLSDIQI